jgi:hypothetical protein
MRYEDQALVGDIPVRISGDVGPNTLVCPSCGGPNLHFDEAHEATDGAVCIQFSCEGCAMGEGYIADTVGYLNIYHHKGTTYMSWSVNRVLLDDEACSSFYQLQAQRQDTEEKIRAIRNKYVVSSPQSATAAGGSVAAHTSEVGV